MGTAIIIIDKHPNNKSINSKKFTPSCIEITLLPKTIKTGRAKGIVTRAPNKEPLLRLRALPNTNKFKKIYEQIKAKGNMDKLNDISSVVPREKIKLKIEIGIPIMNQ